MTLPFFFKLFILFWSFPHSSVSEESACSAGDPIPGSGRFPGEGNGNPLQYSSLENPMDRGAWRAAIHGAESPHRTCLSMHAQNEHGVKPDNYRSE